MTAPHTLLLAPPTYRDAIYCMEALAFLRCLPPDSVDCCVSSPPYFGLRSYLPDDHPNKPDEIGLQDTPAAFVARLVEVYREVRRVLKPSGVAWMNLGDSYASNGSGGATDNANHKGDSAGNFRNGRSYLGQPSPKTAIDVAPKNLLMMPARVALALQDSGWILRSEIVWAKPNPMPESVTDRPTKAHEMVYMLTKRPTYWYDADAVREQHADTPHIRGNGKYNGEDRLGKGSGSGWTTFADGTIKPTFHNPAGRNRRSVWTVATEPTPFAHFATFPQKLIEPMILAGCPATCCSACGKPYVRQTDVSYSPSAKTRGKPGNGTFLQSGAGNKVGGWNDYPSMDKHVTTIGFAPSCDCRAGTVPGVVLDPFMGSGTVALVARRLGRSYIGCDLNPEYVSLCNSRLAEPYTPPMPLDVPASAPVAAQQVALW